MTAIKELIQELKDSKERGETIVNYDLFCDEFLQKEKEQIESAFENGAYNSNEKDLEKYIKGKRYYEKEFLNK